jgi:predicted negative regulator of RcsB-dependent stress response
MTPQQTIETEPTRTQSFAEWIQSNSRIVGIGAALVAVAAVGYWFYLRSAEIKRLNAERGLNQAKQSMSAGNAALAESDLQKVAVRYRGTMAGAQAAMLLAQLDFDRGKYAEGLKALEPYQTANAAGANLSAVWSLTGDGQLAAGKPEDAAKSYRKAAESISLPGESAVYLSKAGRALMLAGKDAEALKIWEKLATDPNALPVRNEALVRVGELSAKPARKS